MVIATRDNQYQCFPCALHLLQGALSGVTSASANKPEKEEEEVIRQVNVAAGSAPVSSNQSAVKSKLLAEMKPDNYRRPFRGQPQQVSTLAVNPIVCIPARLKILNSELNDLFVNM